MKLAVAVLMSLLGQASPDHNQISSRDLPFAPLDRKQVIVSGGGVDGLGFDRFQVDSSSFDPSKQMPSLTTDFKGNVTFEWVPTPSNYIVTDDQILSIIEKRKGEPIYHELEAIRYRDKQPWKLIDRVIVLLFDHRIFCISVSDTGEVNPGLSCDANLRMIGSGAPQLDIGQYMSGTGAFNSHAIFELSAAGPRLVKISSGGRGR